MHSHDCCAVIVNPTSGKYGEPLLRRVLAKLDAAGLSPQLLLTRSADDCRHFAEDLCRVHQHPLVGVGGGDGTINGVVNGLTPGKATLAVLPLGIANVLAREVGIGSLDNAVSRIVRGDARPVSVGVAKWGRDEWRRFMLMAGIGFDARVVRDVRGDEKKLLKQGAYLLAALRMLVSWERESVCVSVGDAEVARCHSVVVCNASSYGGSFKLAPGMSLFSPGFQVVCITGSSPWDYVRLAVTTVFGFAAQSGIHRFASNVVSVSGEKHVQVDGDYLCTLPVILEALPDFMRLIV